MTAAEAMAREGGTIIVCGNCSDNIGGEMFYNAVKNCSSIEDLEHRILQTPMDKTVPDQWQYQILCRILKKHRVIFVTRPDLQNIITDMKMEYADSADNALEAALLTHGKSCSVSVIPNGIEVIVASA